MYKVENQQAAVPQEMEDATTATTARRLQLDASKETCRLQNHCFPKVQCAECALLSLLHFSSGLWTCTEVKIFFFKTFQLKWRGCSSRQSDTVIVNQQRTQTQDTQR